MSNHSGAEILRADLIVGGIGVLFSKATGPASWPIYTTHMPDNPDNALCVYDTGGRREGRVMRTGESVGKPGWQISARAEVFRVGMAKANVIAAYLDSILRNTVSVDGVSYLIQAVKQTSMVLSIGQEPDGKRRNLFTLNGTITFSVQA